MKNMQKIRWQAAYAATLLIPWLLIASRAAADAACIAIGILWLLDCALRKRWEWVSDPVMKTGFIAWAWLLLAVSPFALDTSASFSVAAPWIRYLLLYGALRHWVLTDTQPLAWLAKMLAVLLALTMIDTLWQYLHGTSLTGHVRSSDGRLTGPFTNVKVGIFTAKMLLPIIGFMLFFGLHEKKHTWLAAGASLLMLGIATILLSGERTAFFSTLLGIGIAASSLALCERAYRKYVFGLVALLLAAIVTVSATQPWVQTRTHEMAEILTHFPDTPYGQLFITGYRLGEEHWATGTGLKSFRTLCPQAIDQDKLVYCNLHPHNPYLEWFAEAGLAGLFMLVALIAALAHSAISHLRRTQHEYRLLPVFALATLAVHFFPFMPTQSMFSNWPGMVLWYSLGLAMAGLNVTGLRPLNSSTR